MGVELVMGRYGYGFVLDKGWSFVEHKREFGFHSVYENLLMCLRLDHGTFMTSC